jgi:hypothetical protein
MSMQPVRLPPAQIERRDHDHPWELLYERVPAVCGCTVSETFREL